MNCRIVTSRIALPRMCCFSFNGRHYVVISRARPSRALYRINSWSWRRGTFCHFQSRRLVVSVIHRTEHDPVSLCDRIGSMKGHTRYGVCSLKIRYWGSISTSCISIRGKCGSLTVGRLPKIFADSPMSNQVVMDRRM